MCCWEKGEEWDRDSLVDVVLGGLACIGIEGSLALLTALEEGTEVFVQVSQEHADFALAEVRCLSERIHVLLV